MDSSGDEPKVRRWGRWIVVALVAFVGLGILGHALWGWWEERELDREVSALRAAGERMVRGDFVHQQMNDAENEVPLLRWAADLIDDRGEEWARLERIELGALLGEDTAELRRGVVEHNAQALRLLGQARARKGANWQIPLGKPMLSTLLPDLNKQKRLARLAAMAVVVAHEQGDDREAMERIADLLMLSRAMEKMDLGAMPNLMSYSMSSMAAEVAIQIAPELTIGEGKGQVSESKVREVIAALLNEQGARERAVAAVKWERAMGLEWITTNEALWGGRLPSNGMEQAGLVLRRYVMRPILRRS